MVLPENSSQRVTELDGTVAELSHRMDVMHGGPIRNRKRDLDWWRRNWARWKRCWKIYRRRWLESRLSPFPKDLGTMRCENLEIRIKISGNTRCVSRSWKFVKKKEFDGTHHFGWIAQAERYLKMMLSWDWFLSVWEIRYLTGLMGKWNTIRFKIGLSLNTDYWLDLVHLRVVLHHKYFQTRKWF